MSFMKKYSINTRGFTFIEIMLVVAIIAVLASISSIGIQYVRISGRDSKRVSDINAIRSALNLYYSKYSQYPTAITPGQVFAVNNIVYLEKVPSNPQPYDEAGCAGGDASSDYVYTQTSNGISYTLVFCLGYKQDSIQAGVNKAIPEGIVHGQ